MFFRPRIGQHYDEGFKGYRTLVLGVKHHCTLRHCRYFADCVLNRNCAHYNETCPAYDCRNYYNGRKMCEDCIGIGGERCVYYEPRTMEEKRREYLLSQSNIIEINAFLEENDHYPAYTYFTKLMLNKADDFTDEEKIDFWEHVAFANFLQYFCECPQVPEYDTVNYRQEDWAAFQEVLNELQPEVIFVWNPALKALLDRKIADDAVSGLAYFDDFRSETLTVNRYLYKVRPKNTPAELFAGFSQRFCPDSDETTCVSLMLNALQKARFLHFVPADGIRVTAEMLEFVNGSVWDKDLSKFLCGKLQSRYAGHPTCVKNGIFTVFESEIKKLAQGHRCVSSFYLDFLEAKAIAVEGSLGYLSWFDLGKTVPFDDADTAILFLTQPDAALQGALKALEGKSLSQVILLLHGKECDKLLFDVAESQCLSRIVERGDALLLHFCCDAGEKVCLEMDGKKLYLRRGNLLRGQSLRPSDYLSVSVSRTELNDLVYSVFHKSSFPVQTAKGERDFVELLEGLFDRNCICRHGKRLKAVKGKSGQLLFYGLHRSGLSWSDVERLFADGNIAKNATPKKVANLLETPSPSARYYRELFGL